jgi:hypothetical protein
MDKVASLVYMCVFFNKQYIVLLKLLLVSIKLYSNYEDLTFLIFTQEDFREDIENVSKQIGITLKIHIHKAQDMFDAAASKCCIFEYPEIDKYTHILYLDTDIIVKDDLTKVVATIPEDKLYGMEESVLEYPGHGGWFFTTEQLVEIGKNPAINTGVLLFKNTPKIRQVMIDCNTFMITRKNSGADMPCFLEQPFINYFFYKEGLLDTKLLQKFVCLCSSTFSPEKKTHFTIYHFYGPIGNAEHKLLRMSKFLTLPNYTFINNPTFTWHKGYITITSTNTLLTTWGTGTYTWKDTNVISATFGGRVHTIYFENAFTSFISVRNDDFEIVCGSR